ncbi:hypothetical protein, partial [Streptomyces sp. sk2.1]|uniref:hypothetical protein n=1 Tax=Streptomyces sp. sk2.1 TaxID=2478959 RepID=UPI001CA35FA4
VGAERHVRQRADGASDVSASSSEAPVDHWCRPVVVPGFRRTGERRSVRQRTPNTRPVQEG